ncbi:hypothetical protein OAD88_07015 [Flavobacteriaceae bacterium]|nr:hypothetical protein [Flavobacteriaceae bacterium]
MAVIKAAPTKKLNWIPDNTTNITDTAAKATAGFVGNSDYVVANYINDLLNKASQWVDYLHSMTLRQIYVNSSTGSDLNDGSVSTPYQTIAKCLAEVGVNGTAQINLLGGFKYYVYENCFLENSNVIIKADSTETLEFTTVLDTTNKIRSIYLSNSTIAFVCDVSIEDAQTTAAWGAGQAAIYTYGRCLVGVAGGLDMAVPNSVSAGSGNNNFVRSLDGQAQTGYSRGNFTSVNFMSDVTTHDVGYAFDMNELPGALYFDASNTMDNATYWIDNGVSRNAIMRVKFDGAILSSPRSYKFDYGSYTTATDRDLYAVTAATIKSDLEALGGSAPPLESVNVVTVPSAGGSAGNPVTEFTVELVTSDGESNVNFASNIIVNNSTGTGTRDGVGVPIYMAQKNINLTTNIASLK